VPNLPSVIGSRLEYHVVVRTSSSRLWSHMTRSPRGRTQILLPLFAAFLLVVAPATSSAQVVYDNGVPDNSFGLKIFEPFTAANDFRLAATTQLSWFDWYAQSLGGSGPSTITADFWWRILRDDSGRPGSLVATGNVIGAVGTLSAQGSCCNPMPMEYQGYRFSNSSLNSTTLGAGTYWLAIGGFTSSYQSNYYWANSNGVRGNEAKRYTGSEWQTYPFEGAFTVYGTPGSDVAIAPEPASLVLLATGLGSLGGFVRRRRKAVSS
jgi:hypothetical protein